MKIAGYLQTTLIDWPGRVAGEIWTVGCNFRCPFCHNRDLIIKNDIECISEEEILEDLEKRKKWIDGLVISGGEPLLQSDIFNFCKEVKKLGLEVKIDTNGSKPEELEKLIKNKLVDYVAMDVKTQFDDYQIVLRNKKQETINKEIKKSIKIILESGVEYEFRTTVVPGIHDEEVLMKMGKEIKKFSIFNFQFSKNKIIWYWQNFQPKNCLDKKFEKIKPFKMSELKKMLKKVKEIVPGVEIRGW